MKIMINIDQGIAEEIVLHERISKDYENTIIDALKNGTPLPEHHGRLIDENELIDEIVCEEIDGIYRDVIYAHSVYDANTVIEGDKEKEYIINDTLVVKEVFENNKEKR